MAHVPRWAPATLPVAAFAEMADPTVRRLADLAVGADSHGMFVIDTSDGREIVPTTFHLLNAHNESPNVARFLREISSIGVRRWLPWDWGGVSVLPYTPRVRYGRGARAGALAAGRPATRPEITVHRLADRAVGLAGALAGAGRGLPRLRRPAHRAQPERAGPPPAAPARTRPA
ncbi:lantibiotic dehydratase [Micromonospora sp. M12]